MLRSELQRPTLPKTRSYILRTSQIHSASTAEADFIVQKAVPIKGLVAETPAVAGIVSISSRKSTVLYRMLLTTTNTTTTGNVNKNLFLCLEAFTKT